jgi:hypothetical protein
MAAHGQSAAQPPSPAKICADRWNEVKTKGQTGNLTYRDFAQSCLSEAAKSEAGEKPSQTPPTAPRTPTGAAAAAARPSIKQCADLWNEMKAKNQTGTQTYRDFAQQCLAGSTAQPAEAATPKPEEKPAAPKPRTSVPSIAPTPAPDPAPELARKPDESDREAVNRCNGEWQDYKARHNLTGAKAWHVFMARCLP